MKKSTIRIAQAQLNAAGYDAGPEDGIAGPRTAAAVAKALEARAGQLPDDWRRWSRKRRLVAWIQLLCRAQGIDTGVIDGYWGPQTDYAFDVYSEYLQYGRMPAPWRDLPTSTANPNHWPAETQTELGRYYGRPGENQTRIELPYTHRLSWNRAQRVTTFSCHERVADSLGRVLARVLDHYGKQGIRALGLDLWGGCLNVRRKRGGSAWSTHAWGIAVDYDPEHNRLKWGRDRARFARPPYDAWWRFWEEEGWVSLGRTANYDWMHVQAAKR